MAALGVAGLGACADDGADGSGPTIVVTTNILGDVVEQVVGDAAAVEVIMPIGADPHEFAPSVAQAERMEEADLLVVNGAGFEEGMGDVVGAAADSGTRRPVFADIRWRGSRRRTRNSGIRMWYRSHRRSDRAAEEDNS